MNRKKSHITKSRIIFAIMAIASPLLYVSMYLPIWGGKEYVNNNSLSNSFLICQGISFLCALVNLFFSLIIEIKQIDITKRTLFLLYILFGIFAVSSFLLLCFFGLFFILDYFNVPWFPAQK